MEEKEANLTALLPSKIPLDKLVLGKSMQHIVVRVLRMWEAKNFKLNGTVMSLDLLLLDEKETTIQASIYHRRIHKFKDLLKEGIIYLITNFEVVTTYSHYKVSDNPFTIRFMDTTQINEVAEAVCSIKLEKFRLHTYAEFLSFAGTNLHLFDVVGQILQIQGSNLEDSTSNQKIILLLLLEDNSTIRVTLWDFQASDFRHQFQQTGRDCRVIVCTCMNPKMFAGKLHLNSSGSTKIYINYNLKVVKEFMKRMGIEKSLPHATVVEEHTEKPSLEIWTIDQIFEYLSSGLNQEKEVICRGKIVDICSRNGWKYLSCASCSKKLGRTTTSLICNSCNKNTTIGVARFRVELEVQSGDRTTTFVIFDRDARNLTNTTAENIAASQGIEGEETSTTTTIPHCLFDMVGKTMDFQVKISEYNFQASTQSFTVSRIVKEISLDDINASIIVTKPQTTTTDTKVVIKEKIKTEDGETLPTFESRSTEDKDETLGKKRGEKHLISEETNGTSTKKNRLV